MAWRDKVIPVLFLLGLGILMVYDASSASAARDFGDKYFFLKEQSKWVILGLVAMTLTSFINYKMLYKLSPFLIIGSIVSLILVFIPGLGVKAYGASRWINLGFTTVQPSEIAKLVLIIYLSAWFASKEKGRLLAFLLLIGIFVGLILLQPDMGTAIILAGTGIVLYFLSEAPLWHFLALIPIGAFGATALAIFSPYRLKRLTSFLDSATDPLGASYHIRQALIAIGSGGLFGLGLGNSRQKYSYLPEATTDSIFAIICEELGFLGAVAIISVFIIFVIKGIKVAAGCKEPFGRLLAAGIVSWLTIQTVVNLAAMVALIPLTGVPLPFISYGGSALVVELAGVGILLNIAKSNGR